MIPQEYYNHMANGEADKALSVLSESTMKAMQETAKQNREAVIRNPQTIKDLGGEV